MRKDWLIAHRGAQSDGRENTIPAFKAAHKYPVGWVELDVHTTKDGVVICYHDFKLQDADIDKSTFKELKSLDSELATFDEAIEAVGNIPLIVEIKPAGTAKNIIRQLNNHPGWLIASYKEEVITELIDMGISKKRLYLLQHKHSFGQIKKAKRLGVGGVGFSQLTINPILYLKAMKNDLHIYAHTVNSTSQARLFRFLYPKMAICTDRPDLLQKLK
jgi:glycerophosphoryl diester phosphodiesterase